MKPITKKLIVIAAVVVLIGVAGTLLMQEIPATVSAPMFVLVVLLEVVIAPIPGGAIGYMGAARFGFWRAWPLLYIGNAIGTTLVFYLARRLGAPLFEENVAPKTRRRYDYLLEHNRLLLWLVYTVPLVPVDVLSVLAGLSRMSARRFFTIALTGYVIYTGIVAYLGAFVAEVVGVTTALSAIGVVLLVIVVWWLWQGYRSHGARRTGVHDSALPAEEVDSESES
jgi:uncharacterized membrane protein YdjX (TVP38/TMEM64 family)